MTKQAGLLQKGKVSAVLQVRPRQTALLVAFFDFWNAVSCRLGCCWPDFVRAAANGNGAFVRGEQLQTCAHKEGASPVKKDCSDRKKTTKVAPPYLIERPVTPFFHPRRRLPSSVRFAAPLILAFFQPLFRRPFSFLQPPRRQSPSFARFLFLASDYRQHTRTHNGFLNCPLLEGGCPDVDPRCGPAGGPVPAGRACCARLFCFGPV